MMYINPFLAGILSTILAEAVGMVIYAYIKGSRE